MALGYEDIIDHDTLRFDPALKLLASPRTGDPGTPAPLAGNTAASGLVRALEKENASLPSWGACREAAGEAELDLPVGLADVRIHDLRHTFASGAVTMGEIRP